MKNKILSPSGFTLVELLVVVIVASMLFLAMSVPFMMERRFWYNGFKQASVQRDAEMSLHAMEIKVRATKGYAITDTSDSDTIKFTDTCSVTFQGGPSFSNKLEEVDCNNNKVTLIDGVRTRVKEFSASQIVANKLIDVKIRVAADSNDKIDEILQTRLYLRNG